MVVSETRRFFKNHYHFIEGHWISLLELSFFAIVLANSIWLSFGAVSFPTGIVPQVPPSWYTGTCRNWWKAVLWFWNRVSQLESVSVDNTSLFITCTEVCKQITAFNRTKQGPPAQLSCEEVVYWKTLCRTPICLLQWKEQLLSKVSHDFPNCYL